MESQHNIDGDGSGIAETNAAPDSPSIEEAVREKTRKPIRGLVVGGFLSLVAALAVCFIGSWYSLRAVEEGFKDISQAWRYADSVMEMNIGSLKSNWALTLHNAGRTSHAERAQREAGNMFEAMTQVARDTGVVLTSELDGVSHRFAEIETMIDTLLHSDISPEERSEVSHELILAQEELDTLLVGLEERGDASMERGWAVAQEQVIGVFKQGLMVAVLGLLLWVGLAATLVRRVINGLRQPVHRISSSTAQLTDAARFQVKNAMAQASAAVEISTTMQELMASYNNLTERSKDMVQISKAAAKECHNGHEFLAKSQTGIGQIKLEVERITEHMRTMEDKTHQINSVLEIINDMASQTNLLSINATIEAAGAGEAGRRFAVVAEEIRLLAERAVESTEEIRTLIEDIQETAQVTGTVTLDGEHAVDRGLEDAARVADNFNALLTLVTQTVDAVQIIEATAREQGNAVSQVNLAVESLANTSVEAEKHSTNTLDTVTRLARTARELEHLAGTGMDREGRR
jgi:hypothetical protein